MSFIVAECEDYTLKKCEPLHLVWIPPEPYATALKAQGYLCLSLITTKKFNPLQRTNIGSSIKQPFPTLQVGEIILLTGIYYLIASEDTTS
jgi:hypothetical protein